MKQSLTEEMLEQVINSYDNFSFDVCYTIEDVFSYLEKAGWERKWNYESNGYQVDWWEDFTKDGHKLELAGCMWYGGLEGIFTTE